jgi:hypothetical protein
MAKIEKDFYLEIHLFENDATVPYPLPTIWVSGTGYYDKNAEEKYSFKIEDIMFEKGSILPLFKSTFFAYAIEQIEAKVEQNVAFIFSKD